MRCMSQCLTIGGLHLPLLEQLHNALLALPSTPGSTSYHEALVCTRGPSLGQSIHKVNGAFLKKI